MSNELDFSLVSDGVAPTANPLKYLHVVTAARLCHRGHKFTLQRSHNSQSIFSRQQITSELLALVFKGLTTSVGPVDAVCNPWRIRWPVVTRVCTYWRRTALYTPELWTVIQAFGGDSYPGCQYSSSLSLAHSAVLPLNVHFREDAEGIDAEILSNLSRVHGLTLACKTYASLLPLAASANQLRTLTISMKKYINGILDASTLFNGWETPGLHTIHMAKCTVWQAIPFTHLRRLAIIGQTFHIITLQQFFSVLALNAHLEDLVVQDIYVKRRRLERAPLLSTHATSPSHVFSQKTLHLLQHIHSLSRAIDTAERTSGSYCRSVGQTSSLQRYID